MLTQSREHGTHIGLTCLVCQISSDRIPSGQVVELVVTRRLERRAERRGSSILPLVTLVTEIAKNAGFHREPGFGRRTQIGEEFLMLQMRQVPSWLS